MPRPNRGASLRFIARRGVYYIVWYDRGAERLRSTGTADEQKAQQALLAYRGDGVLPDTLSYRNAEQFIYIPLSVLALTPGSREIEAGYHRRFAARRLHSEWFERCPEIEAEIARLSDAPKGHRPTNV